MEIMNTSELREKQLEILDEVDEFCKRNNIKYFLIAGTLLGAIRHHGFIPWDDDIDIVMKRDEYNKFLNTYNSKKFYIANYDKTKDYVMPYCKLCASGTLLIEPVSKYQPKIGVNIDIFPIDDIPNNCKRVKNLFNRIKILQFILNMKGTRIVSDRKLYKNIMLLSLKLFFLPISAKKICNKINIIATQFHGCDGDMCAEIVWGCGVKEAVKREVFNDTEIVLFEGKQYLAPIGWDEWLTNRYGDYMTPPKNVGQVSHHNIIAYKAEDYNI